MKKIIILFCVLYNTKSFAQNAIIDSLQRVVTSLSSEKKLQCLSDLTWELRAIDPQKALKYAEEEISLAQNIKSDKYIADGYNNKGVVFIIVGNEKEALSYHQKALEIRKRINDPKLILSSLNKIGLIYGRNGDYLKSLEVQLETLKICETLQDETAIVLTKNNIANLYARNKRPKEGIKLGLESLEQAKNLKNQILIQKTLSNLGTMYYLNNDFANAQKYMEENLPNLEKRGDKFDLYATYSALSSVYAKDSLPDKALEYGFKGLNMAQNLSNQKGEAVCLANIGAAYAIQHKLELAFENFRKASIIAEKLDDKDLRMDIESDLATVSGKLGNYKMAYEALRNANELGNIIFEKNSDLKFSELKIQYETEKKEQQIALLGIQNKLQLSELDKNQLALKNKALLIDQQDILLESKQLTLENQQLELTKKDAIVKTSLLETEKKQAKIKSLNAENLINKLQLERKNITLSVLCGLFLISSLLGYLFYNRRKLHQEAVLQKEVAHQQELATQAVLDGEERERKRIAADLHDGVGQTIMALKMNLLGINEHVEFKNAKAKIIFEKAIDLATESAKEVRSISHQMMPNALIKSGLASAIREFLGNLETPHLKINLSVNNLNEPIEPVVEKVLYRIIQESVNNVIKHAKASQMTIDITKINSFVGAVISDNGIGFDSNKVTGNEGIGLKNIYDRVAFLKGSVNIESVRNSGTKIEIRIPTAT